MNEARMDNLVMPFVESAPHITGMLQLIVKNNPGDEYEDRILSLCRNYEQTIRGLSYRPALLSQRETQILALARGTEQEGNGGTVVYFRRNGKNTFKKYLSEAWRKQQSPGNKNCTGP